MVAGVLPGRSRLFEELRHVPLFARLDEEESGCADALTHGVEMHFGPAERIVREGDPAALYVVLEGEVQVKRRVDGRSALITDTEAKGVYGDLTLILGVPFFISLESVTACRIFRLEEEHFWNVLSGCRSVTREVLCSMARRLKALESLGQQQGQLASLGSMAAGLAHELNNPAAAARRASEELRVAVREAQDAACRLGKGSLPDPVRAYIVRLKSSLPGKAARQQALDPIEQSDLEGRTSDWLEDHNVPDPWDVAPAFVRAGFTEELLSEMEQEVPAANLPGVVRWVDRSLTALFLLGDLEKSASRVAEVVRAVSAYSFMDQAPLQEIDLHAGLDDTLTVMAYRLRGVRVVKEYDSGLPRLYAYGGELNQVWTNLIDNAVDAVKDVPGGGEIRLRTALEADGILVEVRDNGHGIPETVRERLFEPLFTTKAVGKGTGIGLVMSRRIIAGWHGGDIQVASEPGDTRFQVRLPLKLGSDIPKKSVDVRVDGASDEAPVALPIVPSPAPLAEPHAESQSRRFRHFRSVPLLAPMVEEGGQIARLLASGRDIYLAPGESLGKEGESPFFSVIVDGEVSISKRINGQEVFVGTQGTGAFLGEIPILLDLPFVGTVQATRPTRIVRFEPETFWAIVGICPCTTRLILRTLAERLQLLISLAMQEEKLSSLGTLAAGLAHELNNPAAAAQRAASHLRAAVLSQQSFICQLGVSTLSPAQRELIAELGERFLGVRLAESIIDPLTRSDREAALALRLSSSGLADAWEVAPALTSAGIQVGWVEQIQAELPESIVPDVIRWVARTVTIESLLDEVEKSTQRIARLVKAVKSYSHTGGQQVEVDVHASLEDALAVVCHKLQGVRVVLDYSSDLPPVPAYPGELAQVWVNLLDNAASALSGRGEVRIRTGRENGQVMVEIQDDGPGIPAGLERRIWEPFFTTRPVGEGAGLGLVTVHRIVVGRHHGDVSVRSHRGDTRFQVRLPMQPLLLENAE